MKIRQLSNKYDIRALNTNDVDMIYDLCCLNDVFYKYHPPFVTKESILEDMEALPPNKEKKDKYYIGFFDGETLAAIMDLILNFPQEKTAWIGLFMMNKAFQGNGVGTSIISECLNYLSEEGYLKIQLGIDKGNPQSTAFWSKNMFQPIKETIANDGYAYIIVERILE